MSIGAVANQYHSLDTLSVGKPATHGLEQGSSLASTSDDLSKVADHVDALARDARTAGPADKPLMVEMLLNYSYHLDPGISARATTALTNLNRHDASGDVGKMSAEFIDKNHATLRANSTGNQRTFGLSFGVPLMALGSEMVRQDKRDIGHPRAQNELERKCVDLCQKALDQTVLPAGSPKVLDTFGLNAGDVGRHRHNCWNLLMPGREVGLTELNHFDLPSEKVSYAVLQLPYKSGAEEMQDFGALLKSKANEAHAQNKVLVASVLDPLKGHYVTAVVDGKKVAILDSSPSKTGNPSGGRLQEFLQGYNAEGREQGDEGPWQSVDLVADHLQTGNLPNTCAPFALWAGDAVESQKMQGGAGKPKSALEALKRDVSGMDDQSKLQKNVSTRIFMLSRIYENLVAGKFPQSPEAQFSPERADAQSLQSGDQVIIHQ